MGSGFLSMPMICRHCKDVAEYKCTDPIGSSRSHLGGLPCITCHSGDYLDEWDGMTCPKCDKSMRALGRDVDALRPDRYFQPGWRRRS